MLEKNQVTIRWQGLSASVKGKQLLYQCDGYCKSGDMISIMGPSGAGKTTLLSLIAKKIDKQLTTSGHVYANNLQFTASQFFGFGVFIYQDDLLHETLTVRQTLTTIAKLRYKDAKQAQNNVNKILREFQLQKCENTYVGGQNKKGISGGEKKRVCIAVEMISKPSVVILDEPTSGLDSHKAAGVLKILRRLANEGCTIIFTIHQPSYLLYSKLSNLILLDKGYTIYQGPADGIGNYLRQIGIEPSVNSTISDFFMMEISDYKANKLNYKTPFNNEKYLQLLAPTIQSQNNGLAKQSVGYDPSKFSLSFIMTLLILIARQWKIYYRNPMRVVGSSIVVVVGVVIVGFFFANQILSSAELIALGTILPYNQISYLFMGLQGVSFINITAMIMNGIGGVSLTFPLSRGIFYKETSSKKYTPLAFFLAKFIVELLNATICPALFGCAVYWINGYDASFTKFLSYLLILILMYVTGNSVGFFIGAIFKQVKTASAMSPLILLPLILTSGLYNKLDSIPVYIAWLQYASPFRYGLHLMLLNQYQTLVVPTASGIPYDYRKDLGITLSFWENIIVVLAIIVFFMGVCFIFLKKLSKQVSA